jgi:hypothetical protein
VRSPAGALAVRGLYHCTCVARQRASTAGERAERRSGREAGRRSRARSRGGHRRWLSQQHLRVALLIHFTNTDMMHDVHSISFSAASAHACTVIRNERVVQKLVMPTTFKIRAIMHHERTKSERSTGPLYQREPLSRYPPYALTASPRPHGPERPTSRMHQVGWINSVAHHLRRA